MRKFFCYFFGRWRAESEEADTTTHGEAYRWWRGESEEGTAEGRWSGEGTGEGREAGREENLEG